MAKKLRDIYVEPFSGIAVIELTKGRRTFINLDDIPLVDTVPWHVTPKGHAVTSTYDPSTKKVGSLYLNRVIWEAHHGPIPEGRKLVFKNGNPLDCRLENLDISVRAIEVDHASNTATVLLTKGKKAIIDARDVALVQGKPWCLAKGYAVSSFPRPEKGFWYIHRVIFEAHNGPIPEGMMVDHKDGDPLNNRLENLRLATASQNNTNARVRSHSKTGVKGVRFDPRPIAHRNPYVVRCKVNGKQVHIGCFPTLEAAKEAYAKHAPNLQGEFFKAG